MNNLKFRVWDKIFKKLTEIAYINLLKKEITYYKTSNYCYTEIVRDFDDFVYRGILTKTDDYLERCYKNGYYFVSGVNDNQLFRCFHVKKIKKL